MIESVKFDKIISNPPFFNSAKKTDITKREMARHQHSLELEELLLKANELLVNNGELDFIFPSDGISESEINSLGFLIKKECSVFGSEYGKSKRKLYTLVKHTEKTQSIKKKESKIVLGLKRGKRHRSFNKLTNDFYL